MAATDDILEAVQVAIYAKLTADPAFANPPGANYLAAVYDQPPVSSQFPYVTIGESVPTKWDAFGSPGREVLTTLHIWSRYKGFTQANAIVAALNRLLDRAALTLSGLQTVSCQYEDSDPMRDPDGITRHVVVRYRIFAQT